MKKRLTALAVPLMAATAIGCGEGEPQSYYPSSTPKAVEAVSPDLKDGAMKKSAEERQLLQDQVAISASKLVRFMEREGTRMNRVQPGVLSYGYNFVNKKEEPVVTSLDVYTRNSESTPGLIVDYRVFASCEVTETCPESLFSATAEFTSPTDIEWGDRPSARQALAYIGRSDVSVESIAQLGGDEFHPVDFDPAFTFAEGSNQVTFQDVPEQQDPHKLIDALAFWETPPNIK
jgi:hypothetical protein